MGIAPNEKFSPKENNQPFELIPGIIDRMVSTYKLNRADSKTLRCLINEEIKIVDINQDYIEYPLFGTENHKSPIKLIGVPSYSNLEGKIINFCGILYQKNKETMKILCVRQNYTAQATLNGIYQNFFSTNFKDWNYYFLDKIKMKSENKYRGNSFN